MPCVAGVAGLNSKLFVLRRYTSRTTLSMPSKSTRSVPTLVDRFSSHFKSGLPNDVCRNPASTLVLLPEMS